MSHYTIHQDDDTSTPVHEYRWSLLKDGNKIGEFFTQADAETIRAALNGESEQLRTAKGWAQQREAWIADLQAEIKVDNELLATQRQLSSLFDCPEHGPGCIPFAVDEVKRLRADLAAAENIKDLPRTQGIVISKHYVCEQCGLLCNGFHDCFPKSPAQPTAEQER